ncbi:MAG: methyltransferase domain-containing protein [Nocardioidaceae bacterium]
MDEVSTPGPDDVTSQPRWFAERTERQRLDYASHFVRLAAQGDDVDEARLVDAVSARAATILDAGCGVGRVAARLADCGHRAAGVDADPILIAKGRELYPRLPLAVLDLTLLSAAAAGAAGLPSTYDVVVNAGNVLHFVADGNPAPRAGRPGRGAADGRPRDHRVRDRSRLHSRRPRRPRRGRGMGPGAPLRRLAVRPVHRRVGLGALGLSRRRRASA